MITRLGLTRRPLGSHGRRSRKSEVDFTHAPPLELDPTEHQIAALEDVALVAQELAEMLRL